MVTKIKSVWSIRTYDVWGNARDGYDVNDVWSHGEVTLSIPVEIHNAGTAAEFQSASPTDGQIRKVFGIGRTRIETDGDDLFISVNRERDGYPIGELRCESHESLSPIRERRTV